MIATDAMISSGPAIYFDGTSSARHDVVVEADGAGLRIVGAEPPRSLPNGVMPTCAGCPRPRVFCGSATAARPCWRAWKSAMPVSAAAIEDRAVTLDRSGAAERRLRRKVVGLSFAAIASLFVTAIFGVPVLTSRLMPYIPLSVEQKLGNAVDKEVAASLDTRHLGAGFVCGAGPGQTQGRAALDKLIGKLAAAAALPFPLHVDVVRRPEPNAFALPGGHIYVYEGLIDKAQSADELAGVLAHEMGHVAHRDGTRTVLQTAGLSFLFGMMLGDFVGGGAVVIAARTVLKSSYSRRVEAAADAFSVALISDAGGDPHALGAILARIVSDKNEGMKILLDHPETKDRIIAINAVVASGATTPLLDAADWSALKMICAPPPASGAAQPDGTRTTDDNGTTPHR